MAYTPINWAENTLVDATKLDKMDNEIDSNEQRLTDIDNKVTGTVTENLQTQITSNDNDISSLDSRVSTNETNISNIQFEANDGNIQSGNTATVNLSFTADYILITWSDTDNGGGQRVDINSNSFNLTAPGGGVDRDYAYIAVKK